MTASAHVPEPPFRHAFQRERSSRLLRVSACAARALAVVAVTTLVCWLLRGGISPEACCMVFLGVTVSLGAVMAPPTPLFLATFGLLAWNYFFTPPDFELAIRTPDELVHHLLFFAIALATNGLTARLRFRERESKRGELRANLLRECRESLSRDDTAGFLRDIGAFVGGVATLNMRVTDPRVETAGGPFVDECRVIAPLVVGGHAIGAMEILFAEEPVPTEEGRQLLAELAAQAAYSIEHNRLEAAAEQARVTAISERLGRALLDNVTHEVKTPVAIILASLHRLKSGETDERTRDCVETMNEAATRMVRVTEELTLMSSVRSRLLLPALEYCDAGELAAESSAGTAARDAARVVVTVEAPGVSVKTDPQLFGTILSNFVSNALRHSPAESPVEIVVTADAARVGFFVRDKGPGVSETDMPRVFDRFYRGSNPGTLGLGLAICRELAEILGARVTATNLPCGGAEFSVSLPRVHVERPPETAGAES